MDVIDMSCTLDREVIPADLLASIYRTFVPGRLGGKITANLGVDRAIASTLMLLFQNQSTTGAVITVAYTDAGATNVYGGNAYVVSCAHTTTGTDRDTLQVELQMTGTVT